MFGRKSFGPIVRNGACFSGLLLLVAGSAMAGEVYKCVDATGVIAFQATPCPPQSIQAPMQVDGQPLVGADVPPSSFTEATSPARESDLPSRRSRGDVRTRGAFHREPAKPAISWECRAADGEVFYRHSHCPHSVPGDGVMRSGGTYVIRRGRGRHGARDAWSPVAVHAHKVSRSEACRQINAVAAVERDGSARDEHVSVYEHDRGRDPCAGY